MNHITKNNPKVYPERFIPNGVEGSRRVFVAISGGVDSSVAAALLQRKDYQVTGVFMKTWADPAWPCPWQEDRQDALRVCLKLGIPFETWDFTAEYKAKVVDYMVAEYLAGRTPNPDVMCNREIKFGLFLQRAIEQGTEFIATGHYVRKSQIPNLKSQTNPNSQNPKLLTTHYSLLTALDRNKDQSYFLWTLTQDQLRHCLFPIGEIESKAKVRQMAAEFGLPTATKKDSQGICFMGPVNVQEFLRPYVKSAGRLASGDIVSTAGVKIGCHEGLDFYTIGQRKGIGIGGTGPYYVVGKNYETNTLVVTPVSDQTTLESVSLIASDVSFVSDTTSMRSHAHAMGKESIKIQASIRYRQEPAPAALEKISSRQSDLGTDAQPTASQVPKLCDSIQNGTWKVSFAKSVRAVTPGQSVVFYIGEEMIGGGVIDR